MINSQLRQSNCTYIVGADTDQPRRHRGRQCIRENSDAADFYMGLIAPQDEPDWWVDQAGLTFRSCWALHGKSTSLGTNARPITCSDNTYADGFFARCLAGNKTD